MSSHRVTVALTVFLVLAGAATLYPPFSWSRELTRVEQRGITVPIKRYAFIFGNSQATFTRWDSDRQGRSFPVPITLSRRLIVSELVLEYVGALLLALLVALFWPVTMARSK